MLHVNNAQPVKFCHVQVIPDVAVAIVASPSKLFKVCCLHQTNTTISDCFRQHQTFSPYKTL